MKKLIALAVLALGAAGGEAGAQIRRQQAAQSPPANWLSVGVGAFSANNVSHGGSRSTWDFHNATSLQYRASLERALSNGIAIGLAGTYVKAPIRYSSFGDNTACLSACDAEVDVYSLGINFEAGGGQGFHQVYGASAGVTAYGNFRRKSDGAELPPNDRATALSGTFSYGFGYGFSPRTAIVGTYDLGLVYHSREGLSSDQRNTLSPRTFRVSVRQGFGTQRRGGVRRRR